MGDEAEPPAPVAPAGGGGLNFEKLSAGTSTKVMSSPMAGLLVFATLGMLLAFIWLSSQLAMRVGGLPQVASIPGEGVQKGVRHTRGP